MRNFLTWIDEKHCLTLALLADAGAETLRLVRFVDDEEYEIIQWGSAINYFIHRVTWLFVEGGAVQKSDVTYTGMMMNHLKKQVVLDLPSGRKFLGGPQAVSHHVIESALSHLRAWVILAIQILKAEFPSWSWCHAMSAFTLQGDSIACGALTEAQQNQLMRISEVLNLDHSVLQEQMLDHRHLAKRFLDCGLASDSFSAWRLAVEETQSTKKRRHAKTKSF